MRSGTCPFISPFMDKRIFLPKESTRHSSLDKKTLKNNNNLMQSRSQFCQTRAMNVMVCKWDGQRKGTLHLSYLIKIPSKLSESKVQKQKASFVQNSRVPERISYGQSNQRSYMQRCIYCSSTTQNKMGVVLLILITL